MEKCTCIKCGAVLDNLAITGFQPIDGLAFQTTGHYGTAFFDPMDESFIEIVLCDECLSENDHPTKVFRSKPEQDGWYMKLEKE